MARSFTVTVRGLDEVEQLAVAEGDTILQAGFDAGLPLPFGCAAGSCGSCRCVLVSGRIRPLIDFAYVLERADIDAGTILACQSVPCSDLEIRYA
jgi:toluene methyl-monooxygenase electron transfer component